MGLVIFFLTSGAFGLISRPEHTPGNLFLAVPNDS